MLNSSRLHPTGAFLPTEPFISRPIFLVSPLARKIGIPILIVSGVVISGLTDTSGHWDQVPVASRPSGHPVRI